MLYYHCSSKESVSRRAVIEFIIPTTVWVDTDGMEKLKESAESASIEKQIMESEVNE